MTGGKTRYYYGKTHETKWFVSEYRIYYFDAQLQKQFSLATCRKEQNAARICMALNFELECNEQILTQSRVE